MVQNFTIAIVGANENATITSSRRLQRGIHKKFAISKCPAILHSCVFGYGSGGGGRKDGHNLNLEIKAIGKGKRIKMKWPLKFCLALLGKQLASPKWRFSTAFHGFPIQKWLFLAALPLLYQVARRRTIILMSTAATVDSSDMSLLFLFFSQLF